MQMIRVVVIEDDIEWQKDIIELLNNECGISIIGVIDNKDDAIKLINSIDIDIVLMGINHGKSYEDSIYTAAEICDSSNTKIIMLTSYIMEDLIVKAFTAGASAYVFKSDFKKIPDIIRETYNNCSPVEVLAKNFVRLKRELYLKGLTDAERHIYDLFEKGYNYSEIESITRKSGNTVRNQVRSILSKLGVKKIKDSTKRKQLI